MKLKLFIMPILSMAFLFSGCGSTPANKPINTTEVITQSESSIEETTQSESQTEVETETEAPKYNNLNDTINIGNWSITVTDVKFTNSIGDNEYMMYTPDEGNKYVQAFVTITNNGKEAATFLPSFSLGDNGVKLIYGDGYEFSSEYLIGYSKELHDVQLNPLSSKNGEIVFNISENVASSEDELLIHFTQNSESVTFKLR